MTVVEWLKTAGSVDNLTILEELAELVVLNGGMTLNSFGAIREGGPLGRLGLTTEEALRLTFLTGCLEGFSRSVDGAHKEEMTKAIRDQIRLVVANSKKPVIVGADGSPLAATDEER